MNAKIIFAASNLKKVVESIFDYYAEVLNIPLNDFIRPDVMRIAEKNNQNELSRMLQLILGEFDVRISKQFTILIN